MEQELIRSNEMLSIQVWVLGGLVSFLLIVLIALAKGAWADVRRVIDDHENRLTELEAFKNKRDGMIADHENDIKEHREQLGRLEISVSRITK